ncbi:MAG: stage III sporulation AC/AD family protein [Eubacteriales bacterium]|nr:stage III sporulation AC/AD family protein [Eubacteriales bacterium]
MLSICAAALVASILSVMLKKQNAEYSLIITLCACALILTLVLSEIMIAVTSINELVNRAGVNLNYLSILLKCLGICFITEFAVDACKDASQNAIASVTLMTGRVSVLMAAFPLFEEFLSLTLNLCGGGI